MEERRFYRLNINIWEPIEVDLEDGDQDHLKAIYHQGVGDNARPRIYFEFGPKYMRYARVEMTEDMWNHIVDLVEYAKEKEKR